MDLVSVIIPYYNKKDYIHRTIKSVLVQSYKKIEILIIFDNSSKGDLLFLKKISKKNKKIKLIVNKKNIGAGGSRNIGIKKSKGKYLAFIDSDDLWKKNKLNDQITFMKKNNYLISHTSYEIIDKQNKIQQKRIARNLNYNDLVTSCDICLSSVVIDKKIFRKKKKYFPKLKTKEDYVLWLKILKENDYFFGLNKSLTKWRIVERSLSSNTIQKIKDGYKVYRFYLKNSVTKSLYRLFILSLNYLWKKYFL